MQNTPVTIVGRIVNDIKVNGEGENKVVKIRVASSRSYRKDDKWANFDTLYITVEAWGMLGENAAQSLIKGTQIIVQGMLYTSEWVPKDEVKKVQSIVLRAISMGVDLSTNVVGFRESRQLLVHSPDGVDVPVAEHFLGATDSADGSVPSRDGDLIGVGGAGLSSDDRQAPF